MPEYLITHVYKSADTPDQPVFIQAVWVENYEYYGQRMHLGIKERGIWFAVEDVAKEIRAGEKFYYQLAVDGPKHYVGGYQTPSVQLYIKTKPASGPHDGLLDLPRADPASWPA